MKKFIFTIVTLSLYYYGFSQQVEDCQWLVRDGKYEIGNGALTNTYSSSDISNTYKVVGVNPPSSVGSSTPRN